MGPLTMLSKQTPLVKTINHETDFPTGPHYAIVEFEQSFDESYDDVMKYHYTESRENWEDKIKELLGVKKKYFAFYVSSGIAQVKTIIEIPSINTTRKATSV